MKHSVVAVICVQSCVNPVSPQRVCLSLLGRLAGGERERLLKQAEAAAPGDPAERREEMEVAMQQVRGWNPGEEGSGGVRTRGGGLWGG